MVTGFIPLPLFHMLGLNFCMWSYRDSADIIMERDRLFSVNKFPVDVLWMDIKWSENYQFFNFDNTSFPPAKLDQMNAQIATSNRRLVLVIDPMVQNNTDYFAFTNGIKLENNSQEGNVTNIFIKKYGLDQNYVGYSWPGWSVWVDFLNTNAEKYWASLVVNITGTNYLYTYWNDMNEPSEFINEENLMRKTNIHIREDGKKFEHRDVKNAYGGLN